MVDRISLVAEDLLEGQRAGLLADPQRRPPQDRGEQDVEIRALGVDAAAVALEAHTEGLDRGVDQVPVDTDEPVDRGRT